MIKSSIKNIVVLPLFIATLLTSFYVMQPQMADAATKRYKSSGEETDTPFASDRFDDVKKKYVPPSNVIAQQNVIKSPAAPLAASPSDAKIDFILEQYADCERDPSPKGTLQHTFILLEDKMSI